MKRSLMALAGVALVLTAVGCGDNNSSTTSAGPNGLPPLPSHKPGAKVSTAPAPKPAPLPKPPKGQPRPHVETIPGQPSNNLSIPPLPDVNYTTIFTQTSKPTAIKLNKKDVMALLVKANPSTGYAWKVMSYDKQILRYNGAAFKSPAAPAGMVGAPQVQSFKFTALAYGSTAVRVQLTAPGGKSVAVKSFPVTVQPVPKAPHMPNPKS